MVKLADMRTEHVVAWRQSVRDFLDRYPKAREHSAQVMVNEEAWLTAELERRKGDANKHNDV